MNRQSSPTPPIQPAWYDYVATANDAFAQVEACLRAVIYRALRRPNLQEVDTIIYSGSIFVIEQVCFGDWDAGNYVGSLTSLFFTV